jgi:histidine triad (HIT) family protein
MESVSDCMGCKTAAGLSAADEVYRDDRVVVVAAQHAVNPGHLVVVTVEHVRNALTMEDDLLCHMMRVGREMGLLLRRAYDGCGVMIAINNEAPCQTLFHAHLHVVPRFEGDQMDRLFGSEVSADERASVAVFLKGAAVADGLD